MGRMKKTMAIPGQMSLFDLFTMETGQAVGTEGVTGIQAEGAVQEPPAFAIPDEEIDRILQDGGFYSGAKFRIMVLYRREGDPKKRAQYLKQEYGTGGRSWQFMDDSRGYVDYSPKGIRIRSYGRDGELLQGWGRVEKRIGELIWYGQYLTAAQMERYAQMEESYRPAGGIPLPPAAHAFPPVPGKDDAEMASGEPGRTGQGQEEPQEAEPQVTEAQEAEAQETETQEAGPQQIQARNFRITDDHIGEGGPKQKFRANMEAIRTLQKVEAEERNATPEEQEILSRYVGWGGLADVFDGKKDAWAAEHAELKAALTQEEYAAARASTLNAYYTPPVVIKAVYEAVGKMGFVCGNILEPSMGTGNFFGLLPEDMQDSRLYGVELDSITGRIARKLYPNADITVAGFETTDRRCFYDLCVGNIPYGDYRVNDKAYNRLGFPVHNYFLAKATDQVRPGGILALLTSRYTMDAKSTDAREYIARRAELLGAVRLPNNAFKANAGTEAVADILFLQKREHPTDMMPDWVRIGQTGDGLAVNSYFIVHPEMVLGELAATGTMYGREGITVRPVPGADLGEQLKVAIANIHGQYRAAAAGSEGPEDGTNAEGRDIIPADPDVKDFSYAVVDGEVYFREGSIMKRVGLAGAAKGRVMGMVGLRRIVNGLIGCQLQDCPDEEIRAKQKELNAAYDAFYGEYGAINSSVNARAFEDDSSYYLLCSLENVDEDGQLAGKADMFFKRTVRPERHVTSVDTPSEALAVSIGERGRVDLQFMSELLGHPGDFGRITGELQGIIFRDPMEASGDITEGWHTADDYLSGDVRRKLKEARMAAQGDPAFAVNVSALEKAQPRDLDASEIDVRLGATWIGTGYIQQFMEETFETPWRARRAIQVNYSRHTAEWQISGKNVTGRNDVMAYMAYGTDRANAYRILEDTLNLRDMRIYDTIEDADGKQKRVLNKKETTLAQQKQQAIKDAFRDWIWKNPRRRQELVRTYNELFNSTRPREYDGSHIVFGGMNPDITLREHQRGAIARVLYGGNTLLAHEVGAGKTFTMVAAAMESKRLGLCQKPLFVVPNHLTLQWANEFMRLYPSAKILVATRKDFEAARRKKFCARIAAGDYDGIIIGHSQFEKIPLSAERQEKILKGQIDEITDAIAEAKAMRGENFTIKQLEKARKSLRARLDKLTVTERKDDVVTFEQLGVDRLFVDEAHSFKNLFLYTKMRNVAGLSTSEAQKSSDMFMKCQYMDGQLLFCDSSTPKGDGTFNVYDDIKRKLLAAGVPGEEVRFIHDADTEAKKKELFGKVRAGEARILLGSTQKMGAGTNVQDRLVAVHHLDVGWRPADMTQRNGRIIRQGNHNSRVQIYQYVTEGTFDAYLYQTLENKQKFISQIMTSKSPVRSCDDVDEQVLSYAEIKALCAGDDRIREKMDLDVDVARLKLLRADYQAKHFRLEDRLLKYYPEEIKAQQGRNQGYEADMRTVEAHPLPEDGFVGMEAGGIRFADKKEAGEALLAACKGCLGAGPKAIGAYRGFTMMLSFDGFGKQFEITLKGEMGYKVIVGTDARGNLARLDNALAGIPERLEAGRGRLEALYSQQAAAQAELKKPFPQEAELARKGARLAELDAELSMDDGPVQPVGGGDGGSGKHSLVAERHGF